MKHTSQNDFGRPVEAVQTGECVDKWEALDALTLAATAFDLSHRTLSVLKALLSFHPGRLIRSEMQAAIVFPANKTLATRLNGMPESTLRRHLATLVARGIVSRHDSANRKRFARHKGSGLTLAFGFDLSPLARNWDTIAHLAKQARDTATQIAALRVEIAQMRQVLLTAHCDDTLTENARIMLRRKTSLADLITLRDMLETHIMSTTDTQNERHIDTISINLSVSETQTEPQTSNEDAQNEAMLTATVTACKEYQSFYPQPHRHWNDVICNAQSLSIMMGIDANVYQSAMHAMGAKQAATVVIYMLERLNTIANPGGYLRRLTQMADAGRFNIKTLIGNWAQNAELSADNYKYT